MVNQFVPLKEQTRRERRIERQRKIIMDAAAELFAQKGYMATTTKDIADAVDIGESTLYGYFSSKKEVLQAILSQQAENGGRAIGPSHSNWKIPIICGSGRPIDGEDPDENSL